MFAVLTVDCSLTDAIEIPVMSQSESVLGTILVFLPTRGIIMRQEVQLLGNKE